ncbi:MAG: hypothetical protein SFH39_15550 [Candidatus Magnetobacterium sp. LHC-1]|nr:hypothetical protein [Nitrospirota bacterium]
MKKLTAMMLVVSLFVTVTVLIASDKISGKVKSVVKKGDAVESVVVTDKKSGKDVTVSCGAGECEVKTPVSEGTEITVQDKDGKKVIRKAVAGC